VICAVSVLGILLATLLRKNKQDANKV